MNDLRFIIRTCCAAAIWIGSATAAASLLTVTSAADSGSGTLRQAISDAAASGDTIDFAPGVALIDLMSTLTIDKSIAISGPGAKLLTVRRSLSTASLFAVITVQNSPTVTIAGLTVTNGYSGIVKFSGTLTISQCAIAGNLNNNDGAGVYNDGGAMTIQGSTISSNHADAVAGGLGAGVFNNGTLTIINSTISGNYAGSTGGGIYTQGDLILINSTISDNHAVGAGSDAGGIRVAAGNTTRKNTIIALNTSAGSNPNMFVDIGGSVTETGYNIVGINSQSFVPSTGDQFGVTAGQLQLGPLQDNGGQTMTHALLSGSVAIEAGNSFGYNIDQRGFARPVDSSVITNVGDGSDIGAYEVQANLLPGCSNINRVVQNGNDGGTDSLRDVIAKVCAGSTITFAPAVTTVTLTTAELTVNKSLTISGPGASLLSVQRSAGAASNFRIFNVTGDINVKISGLTIANGVNSGQQGGGIRNASTLILSSVAVSGNTAALAGNGGGIYNAGTLTVNASTISGNSVSSATGAGSGGGIFNFGGTITIVNSTLSGNSAMTTGANDSGGGIFSNVGTVTLVNSTITGNSGDLGGGVCGANGAVVTARNTIIALNTSGSGPDVNGALVSQGYNLIGNPAGMTISPAQFSDQLGVTAVQLNLGPLQLNGGPTQTHALLAGSFARDAGRSLDYGTDQRGRPRPIDLASVTNATGGDGSDIGAFEFSDRSIDIDGNGSYERLSDGLLIIRYLFGLTGPSLTSNAIGDAPVRSTPQDVLAYLDSIKVALDVDGDGNRDALTDGLLLVRYLSGLRGPALIAGAVGTNSTLTGPEIEEYIQSLMP